MQRHYVYFLVYWEAAPNAGDMKQARRAEARMTPQEMERTMEFIVEQQAQFAVRIDKLLESAEKFERSQHELQQADARLHENQARLYENQATLTASLLRVAEIVEDLAEAQKKTESRLQQTDERLNVLINVVEKHIAGHDHGGHPPQ
jgi:predicted  nucleic acid-binding Zn-ribbon protein